MKTLWGIRKPFSLLVIFKPGSSIAGSKCTFLLTARTLLAAFLVGILAAGSVSPTFAQNPPQNPTPTAAPAPQATPIAPVASLGLAKHDFSRGPKAFPDLFNPYRSIHLEGPMLANSPRIDQLVHDGKLTLSLQDAVELALENSMDIAVQRYYPWTADTDILKTSAGGF